jgi:hypothetical protein
VVQSLPQNFNPSINASMHPKHVRQIVELAFMGIVSAWEEFLERSLVRYVVGAQTSKTYAPAHKYGSANTIGHAYELLSQKSDYDSQRHYLKVTDLRWVRQMADFFFRQHPYGCLENNSDLLKHGSSIRNRVAHDSDKCKADFRETTIHFLQPQNGKLTQGYSPGNLLMDTVQRHFGPQATQSGHTHFNAYADLYESLAKKIVP